MPEPNTDDLLAAMAAFEGVPSEALKQVPKNTRDVITTLQHMMPAVQALLQTDLQLRHIAAQGRKTMSQTATILSGIGQSTETAFNELFDILQSIVHGGKDGLQLKQKPEEIRKLLMDAMNALQFQDIVSQQLNAIQALLTDFDTTLAPLADPPVETEIAIEGAFDATAQFDRTRTDQDDIDAWINDSKKES